MSKFTQDNLRNFMIVNLTKIKFLRQVQTETDLELFILLKGNSLQKCTIMTISCHEIIFDISVSTITFTFILILGDHSYYECSSLKTALILYILYFLLYKGDGD